MAFKDSFRSVSKVGDMQNKIVMGVRTNEKEFWIRHGMTKFWAKGPMIEPQKGKKIFAIVRNRVETYVLVDCGALQSRNRTRLFVVSGETHFWTIDREPRGGKVG